MEESEDSIDETVELINSGEKEIVRRGIIIAGRFNGGVLIASLYFDKVEPKITKEPSEVYIFYEPKEERMSKTVPVIYTCEEEKDKIINHSYIFKGYIKEFDNSWLEVPLIYAIISETPEETESIKDKIGKFLSSYSFAFSTPVSLQILVKDLYNHLKGGEESYNYSGYGEDRTGNYYGAFVAPSKNGEISIAILTSNEIKSKVRFAIIGSDDIIEILKSLNVKYNVEDDLDGYIKKVKSMFDKIEREAKKRYGDIKVNKELVIYYDKTFLVERKDNLL